MLRKLALFILLGLLFVSCTTAEVETAVSSDATPEIEVPAEVTAAREAVLDFLRDGANECVPPQLARWQTGQSETTLPSGFDAYQFFSDPFTIAVTFVPRETGQVYHVALNDNSSGFSWEAVVNDRGRIIETGSAAISETGQGNPSAVYCVNQGHQFKTTTLENDSLCGICVFPDGSYCHSWDYFKGDCLPNELPLKNKQS